MAPSTVHLVHPEDILPLIGHPLFPFSPRTFHHPGSAHSSTVRYLTIGLSVIILLRVFTSFTWSPSRHVLDVAVDSERDYGLSTVLQSTEQAARERQIVDIIASRFSVYGDAPENDAHLRIYEPVTAVLLHWKRTRGLSLVLSHLIRYPYIKEVIVWNNNPNVTVTKELLYWPDTGSHILPELRIVNSPSNLHDMAKHLSCSMASYSTCYYNDDDWLNLHMDAGYTRYIDAGGPNVMTVFSNTLPYIHWEHRRWRFENSDLDLHAGFTWLGTGSFIPKRLSTRFMGQQSAISQPLSRQQLLVGDMFFSLWTNTYPEQMSNALYPIDVEGGEVGWSRYQGIDSWAIVYANILDAVRRLFDVLRAQDPYLSPDPFSLAPPKPERDYRAPCSNDRCIFITSSSPFPDPTSLEYPAKRNSNRKSWLNFIAPPRSRQPRVPTNRSSNPIKADWPSFDPYAISHVHEHEARWDNVMDAEGNKAWPDVDWFITSGSWHFAVDGTRPLDGGSCWDSGKPFEAFDYFGLRLIPPKPIQSITIIGSPDLARMQVWDDARDSALWDVESLSSEEATWRTRELHAQPIVRSVGPQTPFVEISFVLRPVEGMREDETVRKIRWRSRKRGGSALRVCGFVLGDLVV